MLSEYVSDSLFDPYLILLLCVFLVLALDARRCVCVTCIKNSRLATLASMFVMLLLISVSCTVLLFITSPLLMCE